MPTPLFVMLFPDMLLLKWQHQKITFVEKTRIGEQLSPDSVGFLFPL